MRILKTNRGRLSSSIKMGDQQKNTLGPAASPTVASSIGTESECLHYGANERRAILLEKLGGPHVLRKAVLVFYEKQLQDPILKKFFEGVDIHILQWHQFNLMSIAFSQVPENFNAVHLILSRHQRLFEELGLNEFHFDRVVLHHFRNTLQELQVGEDLIQEAIDVVMPIRTAFVQGAQAAREKRRIQAQRQQLRQLTTAAALAVIGVALLLFTRASARKAACAARK
jgi:truncated hemoglobin YjbI